MKDSEEILYFSVAESMKYDNTRFCKFYIIFIKLATSASTILEPSDKSAVSLVIDIQILHR